MAIAKQAPRFLSPALFVIFVFAAIYLLLPGFQSQSQMDLSKADSIPDFKQNEKRFDFPDRGKDYCAPVAVLDSFVWLSKNGYPELLLQDKTSGKEAAAEIATCKKIAELMLTKTGPGTTTEQFLEGLSSYLEKYSPYRIHSLKYQGWNRHSSKYASGEAVPELSFIKSGISGKRLCWINIGWYKVSENGEVFGRQSGHWLTVVGYGAALSGVADPDSLIVRDPNPVLSQEPRKIFIKVEKLKSGRLEGLHEGLPRSACNYLAIKSMGTGRDTSGNRFGLIDGAISLELAAPYFRK